MCLNLPSNENRALKKARLRSRENAGLGIGSAPLCWSLCFYNQSASCCLKRPQGQPADLVLCPSSGQRQRSKRPSQSPHCRRALHFSTPHVVSFPAPCVSRVLALPVWAQGYLRRPGGRQLQGRPSSWEGPHLAWLLSRERSGEWGAQGCSLCMWARAGGRGPGCDPLPAPQGRPARAHPPTGCSCPVLGSGSLCSRLCVGGVVSGLRLLSSVRSPQDGAEVTGRPEKPRPGQSPPQAPSRADVVCDGANARTPHRTKGAGAPVRMFISGQALGTPRGTWN